MYVSLPCRFAGLDILFGTVDASYRRQAEKVHDFMLSGRYQLLVEKWFFFLSERCKYCDVRLIMCHLQLQSIYAVAYCIMFLRLSESRLRTSCVHSVTHWTVFRNVLLQVVANRSNVVGLLSRATSKANLMLNAGAYVHWYEDPNCLSHLWYDLRCICETLSTFKRKVIAIIKWRRNPCMTIAKCRASNAIGTTVLSIWLMCWVQRCSIWAHYWKWSIWCLFFIFWDLGRGLRRYERYDCSREAIRDAVFNCQDIADSYRYFHGHT